MLLPADYVALAGCVLLGIVLSLSTLSDQPRLYVPAYALAAVVFVVHVLDSLFDFIWVWLVPHPAAAVLMLAAVWGPLIAVVLGLTRRLERTRDRRALYVLTVLVGLYGVFLVGRQLVDPQVSPRSWWEGEVLMQSTDSTCIAAASCTYLRTLGVELSEAEAVARGLISGNSGGTQVQAWRILRLSLPPEYEVSIAPLSRAQLTESGRWHIVSVRWAFAVGHAVVVRVEDGGRRVRVRDPLAGEYTKSWDEFAADWLGVGIWAEREADGPGWV